MSDDYFLQQFRDVQNKINTDSCYERKLGWDVWSLKDLVTLPPFQQQQKIAKILSTVDSIEVIDQQIIETHSKKGLMQRLPTKGIGHTEFKDSPFGMTPRVRGCEIGSMSSKRRYAKRTIWRCDKERIFCR
jgi:hypothetical protein